jgi:probable phosphoglycerate mutase
MLTPAPFYFIRHGETDWNRLKLMQGQTDTPLNATGIYQAESAASVLTTRRVATICTSPLRRAKHTAEILATKCSAMSIVVHDGLREANFGAYEGHPSGPWREAWLQGEPIPGGESFEDFIARSLAALNDCLKHPGPVLIVAHGGTFYAVRRWALGGVHVRAGNCELMALSPPRRDPAGPWKLKRIFAPDTLPLAENQSLTI